MFSRLGGFVSFERIICLVEPLSAPSRFRPEILNIRREILEGDAAGPASGADGPVQDSSCQGQKFLLADPFVERRELDVASSSGEDYDDVAGLRFHGALAIVVGTRRRVVQLGERREERHPGDDLVALARGVVSADRDTRGPRDRREPLVGGEVSGGLDVLADDLGEDPAPVLKLTAIRGIWRG